jgi:hypothetical protein
MNMETGRPDKIEDVLLGMHSGQWFGWSDSKNKVYANLEIYAADGVTHDKPTKASLESALADAQAAHDAADYSRKRAAAYPSIADQLDMQYHDGVDSTTTWADAIAAVKTKYAKP